MVFWHGLNGLNTRKKRHATAKLCCYLNEPALLITVVLITDYFWHKSWPTQIFCPSLMVLHIIWSWTPWGMYRARPLHVLQIITVEEWMVHSCTSTSIWKNEPTKVTKNICPGRFLFVLGIWEETSLSAQTIWVITPLQPLWMKNCWTLTTSFFFFFLTNLTPASHSSGTSFINWFALVALFRMQDKFVPNSWTCCPAAVSTGSETTRFCLMNGGICGNYWSFHKAYRDGRDGDIQWTLMNWMLWSSTWNQAVVLDCFSLQQIANTMLTHTVF